MTTYYLYTVHLEKSRGHTDAYIFKVVAPNEIDAIKKAKRHAHRVSGWAARCYACTKLERSAGRII